MLITKQYQNHIHSKHAAEDAILAKIKQEKSHLLTKYCCMFCHHFYMVFIYITKPTTNKAHFLYPNSSVIPGWLPSKLAVPIMLQLFQFVNLQLSLCQITQQRKRPFFKAAIYARNNTSVPNDAN